MKKVFSLMFCLLLAFALVACGAKEEGTTNTTKETSIKTEEVKSVISTQVASTVDPRLQEPTEDTVCEMCSMKVYDKEHEMGMFSGQAIKTDGSIAFYDDIGCLLNAELANNEKNEKFVRDYNTLEWVLVDDATIAKTDLKTPMNWGYAFFKNKEDAQKFISENEGYAMEELKTVKQLAKERREAKMKKQAEGTDMQMQHGQHE